MFFFQNTRKKEEKKEVKEQPKMHFDMMKIGQRIAERRKAQNLTQMNLADELGISFQAVSNWERGETMPDIGKLPEIAEILDCSIDYLLGNRRASDVVEFMTAGKDLEDPITAEEVVSMAPALEPKVTEQVIQQSGKSKEIEDLDFHALVQLAPFIGSQFLGEKLLQLDPSEMDIELVAGIAPFVDKDDLSLLVDRAMDSGKKIRSELLPALAPFLKKKKLGEIFLEAVEDEDFDEDLIMSIVPFIKKDVLHQYLVEHADSIKSKNLLINIAPFVDKEVLQFLLTQ